MASDNSSSKASDKTPDSSEQFDWIQLSNDVQGTKHEGFADKFTRKVMENPFVPIGEKYFNVQVRVFGIFGLFLSANVMYDLKKLSSILVYFWNFDRQWKYRIS